MEFLNRHRRRFALLALAALFAGVALCLTFFLQRASVFSMADERILKALSAVRQPKANAAMTDITALGGYTVLTTFICVGTLYLLAIRKWRQAAYLAVVGVGANMLQMALKDLVARPRPELVPHLVVVDSYSFPSGHALASSAIFLGTALIGRHLLPLESRMARYGLIAISVLLAGAVAMSRVYLGVHWPTDVAGGLLLGWAWALTVEAVVS